MADRPPCANCGASPVTISASAHLIVTPAVTVLASLQPADQGAGWERRWLDVQQELEDLLAPQMSPMSATTIQSARRRLQDFYITAYHLKDALKLAVPLVGITPQAVERVVTTDPDLALLADLANLDKHGHFNRPPRSGHVPAIVRWAGTDVPSGGWRIDLAIDHDGNVLDGLQVARQCVEAWRRALRYWQLI